MTDPKLDAATEWAVKVLRWAKSYLDEASTAPFANVDLGLLAGALERDALQLPEELRFVEVRDMQSGALYRYLGKVEGEYAWATNESTIKPGTTHSFEKVQHTPEAIEAAHVALEWFYELADNAYFDAEQDRHRDSIRAVLPARKGA